MAWPLQFYKIFIIVSPRGVARPCRVFVIYVFVIYYFTIYYL